MTLTVSGGIPRGTRVSRAYISVVGDSWASALAWVKRFPDQPFLGVRFDGRKAWVLFEPKTADGPLPPLLARTIQRAFEEAGDGQCAR